MLDKFDKIVINSNGRLYGLHLELQSMKINFEVRFKFWLDAAAELAMARWEKAPAKVISKLEKKVAKKKFFLDNLDVDILDYIDIEIPVSR